MKILAVRNFFSTSHLYFFSRRNWVCLFSFTFSLSLISFFVFKFHCSLVTVTSEYVCWSIRNVKFINENFYNIHGLSCNVYNRSLFAIFSSFRFQIRQYCRHLKNGREILVLPLIALTSTCYEHVHH